MSCSCFMNLKFWDVSEIFRKTIGFSCDSQVGGWSLLLFVNSNWKWSKIYLLITPSVVFHFTEKKMATSLEDCLVNLSSKNDWRGIIETGKLFSVTERSKFLWAWPTIESLQWLKQHLNDNHITSILSIGCGCGLLEWLINKTADVNVIGLELDRSWWKSAYSPTTFVEIKFTKNQITNEFLNSCIQAEANQFALLFCYFNNHDAFLEYVRAYTGNLIIIVGPKNEQHIVTDPNPLNPKFESDEWSLLDQCQFNDQLFNCMSIFKRNKFNEPNSK